MQGRYDRTSYVEQTNKRRDELNVLNELNDMTVVKFKMCYHVLNFTKLRWFFTEMWQYNDFQNGSCLPSWISCDTIILHQRTDFHGPKVVQNFHPDWYCGFSDTRNISILAWQLTTPTYGTCMRCIKWAVWSDKFSSTFPFTTELPWWLLHIPTVKCFWFKTSVLSQILTVLGE